MASVHKEGNSWCVRARIDGKQKKFSPRTAGFPNTEKGAKLFRAKVETEMEQGTFCSPTKNTVREYADHWLKVYVGRKTTPKTQQQYHYLVRNYIAPGLGNVPLSKLRPAHIEEFYSGLQRVDGKPGELSANTIQAIHRALNSILNHAVDAEVIARNPIKRHVRPNSPRKSEKVMFYTGVEAQTLLRLSEGTDLHTILALAIHTGMRVGEISALRWSDVDLDARSITITRSMEQTSKAGIREKTTKTERGRTVRIGEYLVRALVRHKAEQSEKRLAGELRHHQGHVVTLSNGSPKSPYYISGLWREFIRGTGLPFRNFHALRHTHASLLIEQGVHAKAISERLGHSSISITMDTYGHLMGGIEDQAVERLDRALGG